MDASPPQHNPTQQAHLSSKQLQSLSLEQFCLFLKQYRLLMQPSVIKQSQTEPFVSKFDTQILKASLSLISEFIRQEKARLKAKTAKQGHSAECTTSSQAVQPDQHKMQPSSTHNGDLVPPPVATQAPGVQTHPSQVQLVDKVILYTWQLCNARIIVSTQQPQLSLSEHTAIQVHKLCISTSRIYVSGWGLRHVTMQAMLMAYYNLLKNSIFQADPDHNGSLCCLIEAILGDTANSEHLGRLSYHSQEPDCDIYTKPPLPEIPIPSPTKLHSKQTSTELELEWFVFILQFCLGKCDHFIRSAYTQLSNGSIHKVTHYGVAFLHFVALLLAKVVNQRQTTELVLGYECPIEQVRAMYEGGRATVRVSWGDYEWAMTALLRELFRQYKAELGRLWNLAKSADQKQKNQPGYNRLYIEGVMEVVAVLNCCNFLGGYNSQLQKRTSMAVMELALEFLELSFLIYELFQAKKRNIEVKIQDKLRGDYAANLDRILKGEETIGLRQTQAQGMKQKLNQAIQRPILPLQQGQLVCIIRLLCNLVHINSEAQQAFQDNLKYFRIIMSLTHEFESELTMKNWAIVFLKNVSERSAILRGELQSMTMDVKVDNGHILNT